jgi:hypothetical protein
MFCLQKSARSEKKYQVRTLDDRIVHFGASGYSDFTKHKDVDRKARYIERHRQKENWGKSGINTAGFWSRWLLWNKPTLAASIQDVQRRFNIRIRRC